MEIAAAVLLSFAIAAAILVGAAKDFKPKVFFGIDGQHVASTARVSCVVRSTVATSNGQAGVHVACARRRAAVGYAQLEGRVVRRQTGIQHTNLS